jgi:hypothetical protein
MSGATPSQPLEFLNEKQNLCLGLLGTVEGRALLHFILVFSVSLGELRYGSVESITWSLRLRI